MSPGLEAFFGLVLFGVAFVAWLALVASWIWLIVLGFKTHPMWGIGVLCCYPWVAGVFAVMHWPRTRRPALLGGAGFAVAVVVGIAFAVIVQLRPPEATRPLPSPSASATPTPTF